MAPDALATARRAAARLLGERGYAAEAGIVLAGDGDDFAEVRTALALLAILAEERTAPPPPPAKPRFGRRLVGEEC